MDMNKVTIGYRIDLSVFMSILISAAGAAIIIGAVCLFLFVIGGAIGGGIAGGGIAGGAALCRTGHASRTLPKELVHIDDKRLYLHKTTIELEQIKSVKRQGSAIVITPKQGRAIRQSFLKNSEECTKRIADRL
jgi:hypothetical protein